MDHKTLPLELLRRPIAYHAIMAKAFGSVPLAVMVGQLYYWTPRSEDQNGWVYKTAEDMYEETGVTRRMQDTARALGLELGIFEAEVRGTPPVMHYRLDMAKILTVLEAYMTANTTTSLFPVKQSASEATPGQKARAFFTEDAVQAEYIERIKAMPAFASSGEFVDQQVRKFVSYWTEPSKSGKKVRWEMQSTFDVARRLTTWFNNASRFAPTVKKSGRGGITL